MIHRFYGQDIDTPLSLANNTLWWDNSVIGRLYHETKGAVYISELPPASQAAPYCWRVVDAYYLQEDGVVSYFRAFDLDGSPIAHPVFGVTWDGCEHKISGNFKHRLPGGRNYYVPVANDFVTQNSGGYSVQVLDLDYPSEALAFGLLVRRLHHALVISFRKFELRPGYPNDLEMAIR